MPAGEADEVSSLWSDGECYRVFRVPLWHQEGIVESIEARTRG